MLEVKDLKKSFGDRKVLKGIDLNIEKGEVIGIIGPSGCGKSTLLRCINLLEEPTSGEIIYNGEKYDRNRNLSKYRREVGMVFQQFNLFPHLTVLDNITLAPIKLGILTEDEAMKAAKRYLKKIDLADKANNYPDELSGGQKQRVAICRTLVMNPKVILFDEPTSALDPEMIGEVTKLMRDIKEVDFNMTMIIVSHEMKFIKDFCTRVIFLDEGKIVEDGTPKQIFDHPKDERLQRFLSKINTR
ncbi:MAG: amino acid ABC transporter ATP-binding protein [Bacilli bacterium]|nr:amino acid ABC transporter ATP-binding protein [Bacilli bacterium]